MPQPTPYNRGHDFKDDHLDAELDDISLSVNEICGNLALIQRDDGRLANGSVGVDQLEASVRFGFNAVSDWAPAVKYVANDGVWYEGALYRCIEGHTSSVSFDDSKWSQIVDFAPVLGEAEESASEAAESAIEAADSAASILGKVLTASGTHDFGSIAAGGAASLVTSVTGAAVGDPVALGLSAGSNAVVATAHVSAANSVTIKVVNASSVTQEIGSRDWKVAVLKF